MKDGPKIVNGWLILDAFSKWYFNDPHSKNEGVRHN
jgi:hypothetical protein